MRYDGPAHVLDPFEVTGIASAAYNPLDRLSPDSPDLGEDAASLTEALVMDAPGQVSEAHWNEEAKAIPGGLIMFCVCREEKNRRALATVRAYLTLPPERLRALLELMQDSDAANGLVAPRRQPVSRQGGPGSGLGPVERAAPHPLSGQPPDRQSSVAVGFPLLELEKAPDAETRKNILRLIATRSPMSWAHINMLGEYDFSEEKLRDAPGILPLKSVA